MFDNVTWEMAGTVTLWVFVGLVLRTLVPWLRVAYDLIKESNQWKLPPFEPKYVLPPLATAGAYVLAILTTQNALLLLTKLHPAALVLGAYLGQDLVRQTLKSTLGK